MSLLHVATLGVALAALLVAALVREPGPPWALDRGTGAGSSGRRTAPGAGGRAGQDRPRAARWDQPAAGGPRPRAGCASGPARRLGGIASSRRGHARPTDPDHCGRRPAGYPRSASGAPRAPGPGAGGARAGARDGALRTARRCRRSRTGPPGCPAWWRSRSIGWPRKRCTTRSSTAGPVCCRCRSGAGTVPSPSRFPTREWGLILRGLRPTAGWES